MTERVRDLSWISTYQSTAQMRERRADLAESVRRLEQEYADLAERIDVLALARYETFQQLQAARRQLQDCEGAIEGRILAKKRR